MAEKTGEMAAEMEDVSHVEVAGEMEEYRPDDVVVEEALEEGTVSDIGSDSYESAEDSLYRPSPIVSEGDEEDSPVVAEIRSKKKNDVSARSTDKGKNVVADSSNKKGKNVVDDSSKRKGKNVVDDSSKRKGKNVDAVTSSRKGKKKVVDSSKRRRAVTSEESSEDDGEVRPNTPFRQPGLIHTAAARPTYTGSTRRKLPTRGGGLSIRPHAGGPRQNASSSPTTAANHTSAAGAFVGGNPSTRPTTINPTSVAGPYLGPSSSSRPTTISPSAVAGPFQGANASGPSSTAGPFQGASASTCTRFMQFMPTPGFRPPPPKKP
ncbi:hypothetical protein SESBI_31216 [Sesbania bispinosa]|nr:hypothetical protein SESBI_31216 [Sesbania bispinosa]